MASKWAAVLLHLTQVEVWKMMCVRFFLGGVGGGGDCIVQGLKDPSSSGGLRGGLFTALNTFTEDVHAGENCCNATTVCEG